MSRGLHIDPPTKRVLLLHSVTSGATLLDSSSAPEALVGSCFARLSHRLKRLLGFEPQTSGCPLIGPRLTTSVLVDFVKA
jgi:hypothetical protein